MKFKIRDEVEYKMGGVHLVIATKEESYKRKNLPEVIVPEGYDYYIIEKVDKLGNHIFPVIEEDIFKID